MDLQNALGRDNDPCEIRVAQGVYKPGRNRQAEHGRLRRHGRGEQGVVRRAHLRDHFAGESTVTARWTLRIFPFWHCTGSGPCKTVVRFNRILGEINDYIKMSMLGAIARLEWHY
ncbi:MAG: hypothetical protein IH624_14140 [Phycisphaerae bacterium]|nr:hypothetical protein [Phycisphaerae bacterium]